MAGRSGLWAAIAAGPALLLAASSLAAEGPAATAPRTAAPQAPAAHGAPASSRDVIRMHLGVPGSVYIGQPLSEFLARFPKAQTLPFSGQETVVRVQVVPEGISALAMGDDPKSMRLESIGFNFEGRYEGVEAGTRRTVEGIGAGSTVNDLLGTYGRALQIISEGQRAGRAAKPEEPPADPNAPMRYVYRSEDGTVTSYFVAQGAAVVRLAMTRSAAASRYILKRPQGPGPTPEPAEPQGRRAAPPPPRTTPPPPSGSGSRPPA